VSHGGWLLSSLLSLRDILTPRSTCNCYVLLASETVPLDVPFHQLKMALVTHSVASLVLQLPRITNRCLYGLDFDMNPLYGQVRLVTEAVLVYERGISGVCGAVIPVTSCLFLLVQETFLVFTVF